MTAGFWAEHGFFFILFMALFPRLTMFLGTGWAALFGGPLYWLGWLFLPRLTVAIIGTELYWDTNPVLVVVTWLWALGGEGGEKAAARKARKRRKKK